MPTSRAVDLVAEKCGFKCYQTPTGWKYFGNLMDGGLASLCGEESFGTGADHVREKDGLWAVLAWLSILEHANRSGGPLVGVQQINEKHWDKYGRHYYSRCDYEECESNGANAMMEHIRSSLPNLTGSELLPGWTVDEATEYAYKDPVDGSEAKRQGFIIAFTNGSRLVYRLSGTGSAGATIRVYMEQYVEKWRDEIIESLDKGPLMKISAIVSQLEQFTGRKAPTVIT
jgi:phosphoglucomutase